MLCHMEKKIKDYLARFVKLKFLIFKSSVKVAFCQKFWCGSKQSAKLLHSVQLYDCETDPWFSVTLQCWKSVDFFSIFKTFDDYVRWPLAKRIQNWTVIRSNIIYLLEWLSPSGKGDWFRRIVSSIKTLAWATLFGTDPVIWTNLSKEPGRTEKRKNKLKNRTEVPFSWYVGCAK